VLRALRSFLVVVVLAAAVFAAGSEGAVAATPTCKSAQCLLTQFKRCHAATYRSTAEGADMFTVANADGHCFVSVQPAHGVSGFCASLVARGPAVVAVNCTGGSLPKTITVGRT
jgi:hypothetical protein